MSESLESRNLLAGFVPLAPTPSPWMTGYFAQAGTVDYSANAGAAPDVAAGEAASLPRAVPINAAGLPLLNSRAGGAGTELFIDFARNADGRGTFSLDDDRENFNFAEQSAIYNCWREITGFFSAFNLNVTTVLPPTGPSDPVFSWIQITNDWVGGNAYVNWLSKDGPKGTVNSGDAVDRVSGIIHEYGHNLGLNHQGEFDKYGNKTAEYSDGYSYRSRPIMGIDYLGAIRQMTDGRTVDAGAVQDDVAVIAATAAWSNGAGGDGFRPDDFGDTLGTAFTLAAGSQQFDAFTERYNDADVFKINPTTAGPWNFTATPLYLSQAEPKLELLDASGNVIAARDDADLRNGPTNEQLLNVNLTPGTYYVRVTSGGDYAELGYYKLGATQLPLGFVSNDVGVPAVSGSVSYNGATGTFTQSGGGGDIWGYDDQFRYTYATLTGDGSITARVDGLDNVGAFTKAGVMIRQSLASNSAHAFLGLNPSGNVDSIWRWAPGFDSANVGNGIGPWVRLTRTGNTISFQSSANGTSWTNVGSRDIPMSGPVLIGLATSAWAGSRFEAFSTFGNVSVTGNVTPATPTYNNLAAPANLVASPAAGANTSLNLSWSAVAGASGYVVESSVNGVDFGFLANVGAGVTNYTHANPGGSMRYFYRVRAANGTSLNSVASAVASAVNKPSAPAGTPGGFTPTAMGIGTDQVFLTWLDTSGETGYRIEQSTDGVNFITRYTNGANHAVSNIGGLTPGTAYTFRITPLTNVGDGVAAPLIINTETIMSAVTNLRFTARSSTSITIAWGDKAIENGYRVERSTNGTDWTFLGDAAANVLSWTDNGRTPGTEYYYRVMPWSFTYDGAMSTPIFAATPAASLPAGWSDTDVGAVSGGLGGGGAGVSGNGSAWSLVSAGFDVAGNADAFHYVYRTLSGDGSIVARVDGIEGTANAAKAGLMIRQDLTAGSKFAAVMLNAGGGYGVDVRSRTTANTNYTYQQAIGNVAAPYWLKLTRAGGAVTAAYSSDGVTFTNAATINISLAGTFYIGLASASFSTTQLGTSTFSNVNVAAANAAPAIATAASASPSPVTGTTTNLGVLGADDGGEAALTYTWASTGPAAVAFSRNGTNAAKTAIATFTKAGAYSFTVTITDAAGLTRTSTVAVTVNASPTAVAVSPASTTVAPGAQQQFAATVTDQFGATIASPSITWSVPSGGGTITAGGLYTAPVTAGAATVRATSGAASADAAITVAAATVAPSVTSMLVNGGAAQRSRVTSLTFTFDQPVTVDAAGLTVTRRGDGVAQSLTLTPAADGLSVVVTFAGAGVVGGSVSDGLYDVALAASAVRNSAGQAMAAAYTATFYRLFGDRDGNGTVNVAELGALATAYGSTRGSSAYDELMDANDDGVIGVADLGAFATNYGKSFV